MNSALKILAVFSCGLCLTGTSLLAQSAGNGLIGRQYAGADYTYLDFNATQLDRAHGFSAEANVPWLPKYDFGFRYDYASLSGRSYGASMKALGASLLTHQPTPYGEAYFGGTLGYAWDRVTVDGTATRENGAFWALRAGYEVPVADRTAVNASLGYTDPFSSRTARNGRLEYRLEGNHALSPRLTAVLAITYQQIRSKPDGVLYTGGVRWMF
jgi:hypothetical protein